jgi:hypothetical protein
MRARRPWSARGIRALVRIFAVLVLALWCGQAAAYTALVVVDAGGEACPEDDEHGCNCPPDCGCCARCAHAAPAVPPSPVAVDLAFPLFTELPSDAIAAAPPSAELRDIQHVPKLALT